RAVLDLADDVAIRDDDILDLRPDGLVERQIHSGIDRASGGAYERHYLLLRVFGPDGLVMRMEQFEPDSEAEALARFDELTGEASAARLASAPSRAAERVGRRVRANAATANAARTDAALVARDADALPTLCTDSWEVTDHVHGITYDRQGFLASYRTL